MSDHFDNKKLILEYWNIGVAGQFTVKSFEDPISQADLHKSASIMNILFYE